MGIMCKISGIFLYGWRLGVTSCIKSYKGATLNNPIDIPFEYANFAKNECSVIHNAQYMKFLKIGYLLKHFIILNDVYIFIHM
jgi:hypothetical protein